MYATLDTSPGPTKYRCLVDNSSASFRGSGWRGRLNSSPEKYFLALPERKIVPPSFLPFWLFRWVRAWPLWGAEIPVHEVTEWPQETSKSRLCGLMLWWRRIVDVWNERLWGEMRRIPIYMWYLIGEDSEGRVNESRSRNIRLSNKQGKRKGTRSLRLHIGDCRSTQFTRFRESQS